MKGCDLVTRVCQLVYIVFYHPDYHVTIAVVTLQTFTEVKPSYLGQIHQKFISGFVLPQVAQARNMSIGEHRHCCVTFKI